MKLRLNEKSIRFRVRRSEVAVFSEASAISTAAPFPGGRELVFRLSAASVDKLSVSFEDDSIEVRVPSAAAEQWCNSDEVGIYGQDGTLEIMVEKDFRRTSAPSPDDEDRYPNPRASGGRR